jgi:hypothetical protein
MEQEGQLKLFQLWLGNELIEFTYEEIKQNQKLERELKALVRKKTENALQFFAPHGKDRFGHDCGFQLVSSADWINDREHGIGICCSPNRVGKTAHGVVKKILKIIPCKEDWQIFKNGIKFYDWQGPKTLVVLGYDRGQLKDVLWPAIQKWTPANQLGDYRLPTIGGTKEPTWNVHPRITLKCGSKIIFLVYEQKASVCAGVQATEVLGDEQMPLSFFTELNQRNRGEGGMFFDLTFTPHKVDGRPDTGINSWLYDIWTGQNTRGHKVLRTRITVDDVPDYIYDKEQKKKAYMEHITIPHKIGDQEAIREGEARYYGLFQRVSGLFYPEVQRDIHFIDWTYDDIKTRGWTHYRSIDYGYQNPTAVGFWAVSPNGDLFMYDEYYKSGKDAVEHAPAIIEQSGNKRQLIERVHDKKSGMDYDRYEEVVVRQRYVRTWLDWHSFQSAGGMGRPISFFFQINGLRVCESTTLKQEARAENLRAMLRIDPNRKHMVTGKPGAPRMYISRKCVNGSLNGSGA